MRISRRRHYLPWIFCFHSARQVSVPTDIKNQETVVLPLSVALVLPRRAIHRCQIQEHIGSVGETVPREMHV
jgi:hypothetical protein